MPASLKKMKIAVLDAMHYQEEMANNLKGNDNPQVVECYNRCKTTAGTLRTVWTALNNDFKFLHILGGK